MERVKSLTISDYHFINPIKNPTKKNGKSKKSNEHYENSHRATNIYAKKSFFYYHLL